MKVSILYSGGKDSSLAALLLSKFYEVELVTCNFNLLDTYKTAEEAAGILDLPHKTLFLDTEILEKAKDIVLKDNYPGNAINYIHYQSIKQVIKTGASRIADGTRRNDRVPQLTASQTQHLEDKHDISYISPLSGLGKKTVEELVNKHFIIETGESDIIEKADYEAELRALIAKEAGSKQITRLFPKHVQSRIIGTKITDVNYHDLKNKRKEETISQSP